MSRRCTFGEPNYLAAAQKNHSFDVNQPTMLLPHELLKNIARRLNIVLQVYSHGESYVHGGWWADDDTAVVNFHVVQLGNLTQYVRKMAYLNQYFQCKALLDDFSVYRARIHLLLSALRYKVERLIQLGWSSDVPWRRAIGILAARFAIESGFLIQEIFNSTVRIVYPWLPGLMVIHHSFSSYCLAPFFYLLKSRKGDWLGEKVLTEMYRILDVSV